MLQVITNWNWDLACDQCVFDAVRASGVYATVASEETPQETNVRSDTNATPDSIGGEQQETYFSLGCDPLDGSSIIDANFSVGSIYGIWPGTQLVGRSGREQVAAAVALYGPELSCVWHSQRCKKSLKSHLWTTGPNGI
ncbi:Fructose-1-6-bisphosphatase [Fragilaria crotonensis]|nr:Fructose-1-6-bisphosphatase [Fragilaria crotonensis]